MLESLVILTALLLLATLLPLSRHEAWWVRGLDFPRLQLATLAGVLICVTAALLDRHLPLNWALLLTQLGCLAYHAWWIIPYSPLFSHEVAATSGSRAEDRLSIMAVNVLGTNRNAPALLDMVREKGPDVVVALETDRWWETQLDTLGADYPHTLRCPQDNLYGMHLYSRLPLEDARIQFLVEPDIPSMHTLVVLRSGRPVRLHCLHPMPPSPTENPESSERDAELIAVGRSVAEAELPVVVAGDLNDVAWSATTRLFRKISGLLDPRIGRGMFNTFHADIPVLRWPLDHLFHSAHFQLVSMERLGKFGSDHFPILVELALEPRAKENGEGVEPDADDCEWAEEKMSDEGVDEDDVHTPGE